MISVFMYCNTFMMKKFVLYLCLLCSALLLAHGQGQQQNPGFISIDCGAPNDYHDDDLDIYFKTDAPFVSSGANMQISTQYIYELYRQQSKNLRMFPNGTRNCYTLTPDKGKDNTYLIRASFYYGNYDNRNSNPAFDLHIDVNYWATINSSSYDYAEIIYVAPRDDIQVCLINTGFGTPFISDVVLRLLDSSIYDTSTGPLVTWWRLNIGETSTTSYRHPQDDYDRIWTRWVQSDWLSITNDGQVDLTTNNDAYKVPAEVLRTASQSKDANSSMLLPLWPGGFTTNGSIYFHFAEIQTLEATQLREFDIFLENQKWGTVTPVYGQPKTVPVSTFSGREVSSIYLTPTNRSNAAPILNAIEIFSHLSLPNTPTALLDANAMNDIKKTYGVSKDSWQGDPCVPKDFLWSGLTCNYDNNPPRITALNLSSSNLVGRIASSFSNLTALTSLDLSHNQLTGPIPDLLAVMPNLNFLNLNGNDLSGSIPETIKEKQATGALQASFDGNPNLCQTEACESKKKSMMVIILSVVSSTVALAGIAGAAWSFKPQLHLHFCGSSQQPAADREENKKKPAGDGEENKKKPAEDGEEYKKKPAADGEEKTNQPPSKSTKGCKFLFGHCSGSQGQV